MFDVVVVCVGGGFNVIGIFYVFFDDLGVWLVGFEVVGDGVEIGRYVVIFIVGLFGVFYGLFLYLL